jgi:hypothetical protein
MQKVVNQYRKARQAVEGDEGPQEVAREEAKELELLTRQLEEAQGKADEGSGGTGAEDVNEAREGD